MKYLFSQLRNCTYFCIFAISSFIYFWGIVVLISWSMLLTPLLYWSLTHPSIVPKVIAFLQKGGILLGKPLYFIAIYPFEETPPYDSGHNLLYYNSLGEAFTHNPLLTQPEIQTLLWAHQTPLDLIAWGITAACYCMILFLSFKVTKSISTDN